MKFNNQYIIKAVIAGLACLSPLSAFAKDIDYNGGEIAIVVTPGEPTQVQFPGVIAGGYRKKVSSLSLEHKQSDLVIFANDALVDSGEAIIVRLQDGRSYAMRVTRSNTDKPRDDVVVLRDRRAAVVSEEEQDPAYLEKNFEYAPPNVVAGLMREMTLAAEFAKPNISGYRVSEAYKGQTVLNDGALVATIDRIYMGPNLWGYVLDTTNTLATAQKINPAAFRIDGTRAISAKNWELAPTPINIEQQLSEKHRTKVYIVTRSKK